MRRLALRALLLGAAWCAHRAARLATGDAHDRVWRACQMLVTEYVRT